MTNKYLTNLDLERQFVATGRYLRTNKRRYKMNQIDFTEEFPDGEACGRKLKEYHRVRAGLGYKNTFMHNIQQSSFCSLFPSLRSNKKHERYLLVLRL